VCASILKRFSSERNGHLNDATGQPQIEQRASRRNCSVHRPRSADCLLLKRGVCFAGTSRASPGVSLTPTWVADRSSMGSSGVHSSLSGNSRSTETVFEDESSSVSASTSSSTSSVLPSSSLSISARRCSYSLSFVS
jgi:hypothetical protein